MKKSLLVLIITFFLILTSIASILIRFPGFSAYELAFCALPKFKCISWNEASLMIREGKVIGILQSHSQSVGLEDRDGIRYSTHEPEIDDVYEELRKCGTKCDEIFIGTE